MTELIAVGKILKPVGLLGEVKILPITGDWNRLKKLRSVFLGLQESAVRQVNVASVRIDSRKAVMKFDGIETEEAANTLREQFLFVRKDEMLRPKKGSYLVDDLLGAEVITDEGISVGVVKDVLRMQANDVWSVWNGTREILIPAVKSIVRKVNIQEKKVVIHAMEGLLE